MEKGQGNEQQIDDDGNTLINSRNSMDTRGRSQSFISGTQKISSQTVASSENREDVKIKELLVKIQVLRNAVIEERSKNSELEKEVIKFRNLSDEYLKNINEKENVVITLSKEKYELQSKLDKEKQKNEGKGENQFSSLITGLFSSNKNSNTNFEIEQKKILNENEDLKIENEILRKKIEDQSLDFEKCKIEYQKMINLQIEKMKKIDLEILNKNKQLDESNKKFDSMCQNLKKFDVEKTQLESKLSELSLDNNDREKRIIDMCLKLEDKEKVISSYQESLMRHEIESASLAMKLAELKNAILENNMIIQTFKCEKIGVFNTPIELTFGRTNDNEYLMIMKEDKTEEYVDIEDVEYIKSHENTNDILDIRYIVKIIFYQIRKIKSTKIFQF